MKPDEKPIIDIGGGTQKAYHKLLVIFPGMQLLLTKLNSRNGRIGLGIAAAAVLSAILWAHIASDQKAAMYVDIQRVSNLQQLNLNIQQYYQDHKILPSKLRDLEELANPTFVRDWYMFDPGTRQPFLYSVSDPKNYKICATFAFSTNDVARIIPSDISNPIWDHKSGPNCFEFEAPKLRENDKVLTP